jgi:hypothetical protein
VVTVLAKEDVAVHLYVSHTTTELFQLSKMTVPPAEGIVILEKSIVVRE